MPPTTFAARTPLSHLWSTSMHRQNDRTVERRALGEGVALATAVCWKRIRRIAYGLTATPPLRAFLPTNTSKKWRIRGHCTLCTPFSDAGPKRDEPRWTEVAPMQPYTRYIS